MLSCDALDRELYGCVVARCDADGVAIEMTMVAVGLTWAFLEYSRDYSGSEAAARETDAGIWQAETQTAQAWRADEWARAVTASPGGCPIKGNIKRRSEDTCRSFSGRARGGRLGPLVDRGSAALRR